MRQLTSIRWVDDNTAERITNEVHIRASVFKNDTKVQIIVDGAGDCKHHLIEDTAILLNKMAEKMCGHKI